MSLSSTLLPSLAQTSEHVGQSRNETAWTAAHGPTYTELSSSLPAPKSNNCKETNIKPLADIQMFKFNYCESFQIFEQQDKS